MANPLPNKGAIDLGNGMAGTFYDDGSVQIWRIDTGQQVAWVQPGDYSYDLGTGQAASAGPGGLQIYDIGGQPNASGFPGYNSGALPPPVGAGQGAPGTLAGTQGPALSGPSAGNPLTARYPWLASALPQNLAYAQGMPGYLPGSRTYNQWDLSQPGLLGTVAGVPNVNLRYGLGGTGDPTNGSEPQTPQQFVNGPKLFNSTRQANWGQGDQEGSGLDYIATTFLRSDTPSGINTSAWGAPDAYWQGLAQQIAAGTIQPTKEGWALLAQRGYTPQKIGGAAPAQAAGAQSGGAGGADSSLQDYLASIQANAQAMQAAQLAYQDWYMRTQDDEQAFQHAQQTYENKWAEQMQTYQQQKDQWTLQQSAGYFDVNGVRTPTLAGVAQDASLTGMYQGKPTFQREQYETGEMNNLLSLQASLRGPQNYGQYLKVLGSTPQGMRDVVNSAAGRFTMPTTTGVNGQPQSADVQSLLNDVTTGNQGAQQEWQQALSGGLPAPNQINLANWGRMLPTQQKMLTSAYESAGWDPNDFTSMLAQSAPVGAGGRTGTFRF